MTGTPTKDFENTPTKSELEGKHNPICHFRSQSTLARAFFLRVTYEKQTLSVDCSPYLQICLITTTQHLDIVSDSTLSQSSSEDTEMEAESVDTEEEPTLLDTPNGAENLPPHQLEEGQSLQPDPTANSRDTVSQGGSPSSVSSRASKLSEASAVRRSLTKLLYSSEDRRQERREDRNREAKAKGQSARDLKRELPSIPDGSDADVTLGPSGLSPPRDKAADDHQPPQPDLLASELAPTLHSTPKPPTAVPSEPLLEETSEKRAGSPVGKGTRQPQPANRKGRRNRGRGGKGSGPSGKSSKTAEQGEGDAGAPASNPADVFATGDAVATITITRTGEGGDAHNTVARALFQLPEFFNVLTLRQTLDGAIIDVDDDGAETIVRRHLVPQGWSVTVTPIWPRYQFVVPGQLSGPTPGSGLDPATIVRGLVHRNAALFGFPADSVNYANHTWETVEEEGGGRLAAAHGNGYASGLTCPQRPRLSSPEGDTSWPR